MHAHNKPKIDGLREPNTGYLSCTAAYPIKVLILRSNVIIFIPTTAYDNAKYVNEALVSLSVVKEQ